MFNSELSEFFSFYQEEIKLKIANVKLFLKAHIYLQNYTLLRAWKTTGICFIGHLLLPKTCRFQKTVFSQLQLNILKERHETSLLTEKITSVFSVQ